MLPDLYPVNSESLSIYLAARPPTLQCYFEIADLSLACYLLKFSVFIACLITKAINSFTLNNLYC